MRVHHLVSFPMNSASRGGIPLGFLMRIVPSLQEETKEKDPKETLDGTHAYWSRDMEIDLTRSISKGVSNHQML